MKVLWASLCTSMSIACGSEPGANATIYVDPPRDGIGCVGVAGFILTVSPTGQPSKTEQVPAPATILSASDCAFPGSFSVPDLAVDLPVTVGINGFDGSGKLRVSGEKSIQSLRDGPVHLELKSQQILDPLLVFERKPYLGDAALSEVTNMSITTQMMGMIRLLSVNASDPGVFFDREPGAYGISMLDAEGGSTGMAIIVAFTAAPRTIRDARLTLDWNALGRYYTAR